MKITTGLAGTTFRKDIQVKMNETVIFVAEPDNQFDQKAVKVCNSAGKKIGYLPKLKAGMQIDVQGEWHKTRPTIGKVVGLGYSADGGKTWNNEGEGKILSVTIQFGEGEEDGNFKEYEKEGKKYKRISTVLKKMPQDIDFLFKWGLDKFNSYDEYIKFLNQSAEDGTAMHKKIEEYLKAYKRMCEKGDNKYFKDKGFLQLPIGVQNFFIKLKEFKVLGLEETIFDEELGIAGTYDALLEIDGKIVLLDWKSSKKVQDKHRVQVGFYGHNKGVDIAWVVAFGAENKQGYSISKVDIEKEYKKVELICKYF